MSSSSESDHIDMHQLLDTLDETNQRVLYGILNRKFGQFKTKKTKFTMLYEDGTAGKIYADYLENMPIKDIIKKYGITHYMVTTIIKNENINRQNNQKK